MKSFPFAFGGKEYHLRKLDQDAKEDLLDRVTAGRLRQAQRMLKKGFITPAEFVDAKQAAFVKWGTEAFVVELADDENAKAFVRAIVVEALDDATVAALVKEQREPDSDLAAAVARMAEDDDPGEGDPADPKAGPPA